MTSGLSLRVPSLVEWLCTLKEATGTIFTLRTKTAGFLCSTSIWGQVGELLKVSRFNPFVYSRVKQGSIPRGGSRNFFRRGCTRLLLYINTNKPHSFFLQNTSYIRKPQVISGGRGVRTPCTLPLDPPLILVKMWLQLLALCGRNEMKRLWQWFQMVFHKDNDSVYVYFICSLIQSYVYRLK